MRKKKADQKLEMCLKKKFMAKLIWGKEEVERTLAAAAVEVKVDNSKKINEGDIEIVEIEVDKKPINGE